MQKLTPEGQRALEGIAQRHGISVDAALTLLRALTASHGTMAQFSHPELGGMGQWSQGGMIMVGNMFDQSLKARVDALCTELAALLRAQPSPVVASPTPSQAQSQSSSTSGVSLFVSGTGTAYPETWWPAELGSPSSAGAQNDLQYAFFPTARRLAIKKGGQVTLFDTGDHRISGVSQQQSEHQSLTFTSQRGLVRLSDLAVVEAGSRPSSVPGTTPARATPQAPEVTPSPVASEDVLDKIERLSELHQRGILTDEEFTAKKADLLSRV